MSSTKASWLGGIAALTAGYGADFPEAQYDAIVIATTDCGWRDDPNVKRVLVVATDAAFHLPGFDASGNLKPHVNDEASTIAALQAQNIIVIGLEAPDFWNNDPGDELDNLASETGGSVQPLSPDGSNIAEAILNGLEEVTTDVWFEIDCEEGLSVSLLPEVHYNVPDDTEITFAETISVADDSNLEGKTLGCTVTFIANGYPEGGAPIGTQRIEIYVDNTPPLVSCLETVNPSGKNIPKAGDKNGQNEDGFYQLIAEDAVDLSVEICVEDENGALLGCYASGTNVKYTESKSPPRAEPWEDAESFVEYHIFGNGDIVIYATDSAGNVSAPTTCFVPPLPK